jgi:hypothetical protein
MASHEDAIAATRRLGSDAGAAQSNLNAGTRKPRVLPEPVFATPMTSLPCKAGGLGGHQNFTARSRLLDGVAMPVPHLSTGTD